MNSPESRCVTSSALVLARRPSSPLVDSAVLPPSLDCEGMTVETFDPLVPLFSKAKLPVVGRSNLQIAHSDATSRRGV